MSVYLQWAIIHLGALVLMLLCASGLGNLFVRTCRFQNLTERLVFTCALGLGLCGLGLFFLGLVGLLWGSVIWILTLLGATTTVWHFMFRQKDSIGIQEWRQFLSARYWKELYKPRKGATVTAFLLLLAAGCWILLIINSQYPPHNWDSTSNHLVIARANLNAHRLVIVPGIPMPVLPLLNHMLFTWALALKDDVLAQLVVHTFLMLIALGLFAWGKRQSQPLLGAAAAALWLAHPLIRELGATAYVDITLTCFVFLGVYALRVFWDGREARWWYLGMALLAMAAGTKITGLFFVGLASLLGLCGLALFWLKALKTEAGSPVENRFNWKPLLLGCALAFLIVTPWYEFIAYHTGNALWPLFPEYSKGVWGNPALKGYMSGFVRGTRQGTLQKFFTVYVDFLRYPARFDAENNLTLFPLIVLWPLAWLVALFNRSVRWWVSWALAFTIFWFLQVPLIRYWLPALPLAGLALCESTQWLLERIRRSIRLHNTVWVTMTIVILLWVGYDMGTQIDALGLPPATPEARETFLSRMNGYSGVKYVNAHAKSNDTVCVLGASWLNYFFQPRVIDLRGLLYANRQPSFRWPNDELWTQWLDYENANWIFIYYQAPEFVMPKHNPVTQPFWPNYQLVYWESGTWIFRRRPVPPGVSANENTTLKKVHS